MKYLHRLVGMLTDSEYVQISSMLSHTDRKEATSPTRNKTQAAQHSPMIRQVDLSDRMVQEKNSAKVAAVAAVS